MALFVSIILLSIGLLFIGIGSNAWSRGGYSNVVLAGWWGIAGYLIFGIGSYFTYYSYVVKPAKESRQIKAPTESHKRPRIFFEKVLIRPWVLDEVPGVDVVFSNTGTIDAYNIEVFPRWALHPKSFAGPLEPAYADARKLNIKVDVLPPNKPMTGRSNPGQDLSITKSRLALILSGEGLLFFYGTGSYKDEAGALYPIDFCYVYRRENGTLGICEEKYWPKKQDSQTPN